MKNLQIMIISIVSIVVIVMISVGVFIEKLNNNPPHTYADITITGLKENYTLNEPMIFFVVLEGYGTDCGYVNETITRENDQHIYSTFGGGTPCNDQPNYFKFNAGSSSTTADLPGNYTLRASFYDTVTFQHASTKKNFSIILPKNTTIYDTGMFPLSVNVINTNFTVNYNISQGEVSEIKLNKQSGALEILLQNAGNGTLAIDLPRALIDAKIGNMDDRFFVLEDGQEILYKEIHKTIQNRILSIPLTNGTEKIEIIGVSPI
jgi:hypothetical protein